MPTRPDVLLRLDAFLILLAILAAYAVVLHGNWGLFVALFLVPDLSLLGYAAKGHGGMLPPCTTQCTAMPCPSSSAWLRGIT